MRTLSELEKTEKNNLAKQKKLTEDNISKLILRESLCKDAAEKERLRKLITLHKEHKKTLNKISYKAKAKERFDKINKGK